MILHNNVFATKQFWAMVPFAYTEEQRDADFELDSWAARVSTWLTQSHIPGTGTGHHFFAVFLQYGCVQNSCYEAASLTATSTETDYLTALAWLFTRTNRIVLHISDLEVLLRTAKPRQTLAKGTVLATVRY